MSAFQKAKPLGIVPMRTKCLFLTAIYPWDIDRCTTGTLKRMRSFLEAIGRVSDLDILFYIAPGLDDSAESARRMEGLLAAKWSINATVHLCRVSRRSPPSHSRLRSYFDPRELFRYPCDAGTDGPAQLEAFERCLASNPDILFVHRLNVSYPTLATKKQLPAVFFDLDDIEHVAYVRDLRQPPYWRSKFLQYLKLPYLVRLERRVIKMAEKSFVCSEQDVSYLKKVCRLTNVVSIPNAIAIPAEQDLTREPVLLFIGLYSYPPNSYAADHLIKNIWPQIRLKRPDAKLIIAGSHPDRIASYLDKPAGVEFTGYVDDLDELYRKVRLVCCPVLSGGGTRLKIIEAAAYGKPVVATTVGAEGLCFTHGTEIVIADRQDDFAGACLELLSDFEQSRDIGSNARRKACDLYDRSAVLELVNRQLGHL